jgi:alpha-ketoglutaric semialdehyde dehydrogenase
VVCVARPRWSARCGVLSRPIVSSLSGLPASLHRARPSHPGDEQRPAKPSQLDSTAVAVETRTYRNFIGGEWVDAVSGETFESTSPATGELIGVFPRSGAEDVDRAVEAAKAAYEDWRLVPAPARGEILYRFGALVREHKDELALLMSREMGKVLPEAGGDVQEAIDMSFYMAGEGRRLFGQTTPSELPDKFNMSIRMPIGVVGVITPWNFPIAIPSWKIAPALVCGNTVVFKPATDTPALGERFVELLVEAGVPPGVVNVVHGGGGEVGERLVQHPDVPVITLTGSRETGVAVMKSAADNLKHVHLELGGKNAVIVLDDADLDLAADGIIWSAFGTSGQRCTAASRVIVHERVYGELQSKLVAAAERLRLGPGWEPDTDVGPVINGRALEKIHSYTGIGQDEGAALLTGGEVAGGDGLENGFFYRPTIFGDVEPGMRIAQEEIFGPTTALIPVKDADEAIRVANGVRYGLSSSIFTRDVNNAFRAMRDLVTGITYVNAGTIGAEVHLPFGGMKETGNGHREAGQAALDVFTEWKSIYVDYSGKLQKAQIDVTE